MEQQPQQVADLSEEAAALTEYERLIHEGVDQAWHRGQRIDDLTAKRIARSFDPGSGPLHEFAETGAIPDEIEVDVESAVEVLRDLQAEARIPWLAALDEYFAGRLIKSELPYWNDPSME